MKNILLIGTGPMAVDYCKVCLALNIPLTVIGRGANSAKLFFEKTGIQAVIGGVETYLNDNKLSKESYVIIATGTENLMRV